VYFEAAKYYECGRNWSKFTLSYTLDPELEWPIALIMLFILLLTSIAINRMHQRIHSSLRPPSNCPPGPKSTFVKKVLVTLIGLLVVGVMCVPTVLYIAVQSLPNNNSLLDMSQTWRFVFEWFVASFLVLVSNLGTAVLGKPIARVVSKEYSDRFVLLARIILVILARVLGVILLDNSCWQFWKVLWKPCAPESTAFDIFIVSDVFKYKYAALKTRDICAIQYQRGKCGRRVIELTSVLMFRKIVIQAFASPLAIIATGLVCRLVRPNRFRNWVFHQLDNECTLVLSIKWQSCFLTLPFSMRHSLHYFGRVVH